MSRPTAVLSITNARSCYWSLYQHTIFNHHHQSPISLTPPHVTFALFSVPWHSRPPVLSPFFSRIPILHSDDTTHGASAAFRRHDIITIRCPSSTLQGDHGHNRCLVLRSQISPHLLTYSAGPLHKTIRASPPLSHNLQLTLSPWR